MYSHKVLNRISQKLQFPQERKPSSRETRRAREDSVPRDLHARVDVLDTKTTKICTPGPESARTSFGEIIRHICVQEIGRVENLHPKLVDTEDLDSADLCPPPEFTY